MTACQAREARNMPADALPQKSSRTKEREHLCLSPKDHLSMDPAIQEGPCLCCNHFPSKKIGPTTRDEAGMQHVASVGAQYGVAVTKPYRQFAEVQHAESGRIKELLRDWSPMRGIPGSYSTQFMHSRRVERGFGKFEARNKNKRKRMLESYQQQNKASPCSVRCQAQSILRRKCSETHELQSRNASRSEIVQTLQTEDWMGGEQEQPVVCCAT
jgi:hypothetical protein